MTRRLRPAPNPGLRPDPRRRPGLVEVAPLAVPPPGGAVAPPAALSAASSTAASVAGPGSMQ